MLVGRCQMLAADLFEDRVRAGAAIAQIDRRAAEQIVVAVIDDVAGDALPERRDHRAAAVLGGDAGAADFHHATGQRVEHRQRSEEHTSELPSLMRTSYAVFCLTKK